MISGSEPGNELERQVTWECSYTADNKTLISTILNSRPNLIQDMDLIACLKGKLAYSKPPKYASKACKVTSYWKSSYACIQIIWQHRIKTPDENSGVSHEASQF